MDDLFSDDNTPLDFHTIIITQIEKGKSPILLKNYGVDWFNTNIYNYYCNLVRDYISQHSPFDLMSNRAILNEIDTKVLKQMKDYVAELSKEKEFPVVVKQVTIGKAIPNSKQLEEMNNTAKAVQAKQTQDREAEVQMARGKAERERAKADKAYREELGLTIPQFIELRKWEVIEKKQGANIDVIVGGGSSAGMIYNVK
jgi:regulator of protease activity HflC (stomatin/prohibitin superfamily)